MQRVLDNALSGIATDNYEMPLHHKNGDRIEILLNANPQVPMKINMRCVVLRVNLSKVHTHGISRTTATCERLESGADFMSVRDRNPQKKVDRTI